MTRYTELLARWRTLADTLEPYAAPAAIAWRAAADELEAAQREEADELLTLEAAALASGYSVETLRKLVAHGTIPNAGKKHRPRIRRADLPRRAGQRTDVTEQASTTYDPEADALSLLRVRRPA